ncbi:MAG: hypothetical protein COU51_02495 [Parcubacteria group bacterium CG10_big_fil_rev_8_21_14_0_10_36_14]|nr:MAG: hypothetical protein COU51_02495 [Parcubacteria group bacterium CG10_big_fil_rev_8_21_14_0_10_36_14]
MLISMKIVIISSLFPPNSYGGAEQIACAEAEKLAREGNKVIVLTLKFDKGYACSTSDAKNLQIIEVSHKNIFNYYNIGKKSICLRFIWHIIDTFNFRLANDIAEILKRESPDIVTCHNIKGLSLLTPLKIKKLKIKNYAVVHDVSFYTPSGLIEWGKEKSWEHMGVLTRIYRFFTRRLMSYPEKIFFPSRWLLDFYYKNGFFINQEKLYKPNELGFVCENKSVDSGGKVANNFLYVGKIEHHKGILLLLDAFERLKPTNVTLDIIGNGVLMSEVKKHAQTNPNIKIHGQISREKLPEFYRNAKAVIVPSVVYENAPNVVYEALSCGVPVIVARIGGACEPIIEGKNGYIFNPGDVDDLVEKMKKYL